MIFDNYFRSKKIYMLFVLPFLVTAITLFDYYFHPVIRVNSVVQGLIHFNFLTELAPPGGMILNLLMILGIAYLMFFINARYKFLAQQTTLPSVIYILLTASLFWSQGFSYLLLAVLLTAFAFAGLQGAINNTKSNSSIYDFGFWISWAVLIYPKLALLILWSFCVLFFSGRSTLKDISALLLGVVTPIFFTVFYYFWTDSLNESYAVFRENLISGELLKHFTSGEIISYSILLFLLLISLYTVIIFYPISVVNQRRGILSLLSLLFFGGISVLIIPGIEADFMYILTFPLAYLYSQYFLTLRLRLFGDILFLLLLSACFMLYL